MESIFSNTSQLQLRKRPLSNPKVRSASLGISSTILTCEEQKRLLAEDLAKPHSPEPKFPILVRKFYSLYIYRGPIRFLHQAARLQCVRLALRFPKLEPLVPLVRNLVKWGAFSDKLSLVSGEALSTAPLDSMVRHLRAYQDEFERIKVVY
jgi:hypothetical protein